MLGVTNELSPSDEELSPSDVPTMRKELFNVPIDNLDRDLLMRRSRLLYPDVEEWVLEMAVEAYVNGLSHMSDKKQEE